MEVKFNVIGKDRKALVKAISEITGAESKYKGAPRFDYEVDYLTIDKDGTLIFDDKADREGIEHLLEALVQKGLAPEQPTEPDTEDIMKEFDGNATLEKESPQCEIEGLTVEMPRGLFTDMALDNLEKLIEVKSELIKKALDTDRLPIRKTEESIAFPWFHGEQDSNSVKAYTHFVTALCEMAKTQKRINTKEKEIENEKYAFRCFLLRLGFIGSEYKEERKVLLKNLIGSSAFKGGAKNEISK